MTAYAPLADLEDVAVAFNQARFAVVADMTQGHPPTSLIVVDLSLDPTTPGGISQRKALCIDNARIVLDPKIFDEQDPSVAVFHRPEARTANGRFPPFADWLLLGTEDL